MKQSSIKQSSMKKRKSGSTIVKRSVKCRRCPKGAAERAGGKSKSRKLVVVFDEDALTQVQQEKYLRKVNCENWDFPKVRRNKKIQKVMQMERAATQTDIEVKTVTTTKASLSKLDCVYDKCMVQLLEDPDKFAFTQSDWIHQHYWKVTKGNSKSVFMESDFMQDELVETRPEFESDIGVLSEAVRRILSRSSNDVVAINTHPGHHAAPRRSTNYCAFNGVVLAAGLMKKKNPRLKVGVIDIDIHPGDGTLRFVKQNQHVLDKFVSIHCDRSFWKSRMGTDFGPYGIKLKKSRGKVTSLRFQQNISRVMAAWDKAHLDVIIVSLGFDTLKCDPLAGDGLGFQVLASDFYDVGNLFAQRREQIFFIQEGGYDVTQTAVAFDHLVRGFRQGRKKHSQCENSVVG